MCIEVYIQRFFSPYANSWTAPAPPGTLDALDASVLRRLRYLALCPLLVAVWTVAALAMGGASPQRLGTLGACAMQTVVLCATCARAGVRCGVRCASLQCADARAAQLCAPRAARWRRRSTWCTS
jgi:hypothetical protein